MFSNFSSFAIDMWGERWMTSEHAYQAQKFEDEAIRRHIRDALSAHDAKVIARTIATEREGARRPNWHEIKLGVMEEIVRRKIEQHLYVRRRLLETAGRTIIEDSPSDSFWGRGPDWKGYNHLGKIWMKIRDELIV